MSFTELGWPGSVAAENDQYARAAVHSSGDHSLASLTSGAPVLGPVSGPPPGGEDAQAQDQEVAEEHLVTVGGGDPGGV